MSPGAWMMVLATALSLAALVFVISAMVRSIANERSKDRSVWREFGLGLSLMILFFATWVAHGIAQWQTYTDQQREHGQPIELGDFVSEFGQATLENWQSEFLQLFAFVVLAALYIHKGSAESKDSDEKMEASLRRIEEHLGTLPEDAPKKEDERWQLPETPLKVGG
jgi:succinate dehydrogenase hydrophobic anchor subunit